MLRWITPLNLTDPKLSDFKPDTCKTLHDIIRFAHQMGIAEMFELGEKARHEEAYMVRLKTTIPLNLYLIDLGGGVEAHRRAPFVAPEAITSVPMKALWKGIVHPDVSWAGPVTMDAKGLYSVFTRSLAAPAPQDSGFWIRTLAIISRNYLNFSSRLGYHFATIDAFMGEVRNDNYISFRFKGGAADEHRRVLRARFLGRVSKSSTLKWRLPGIWWWPGSGSTPSISWKRNWTCSGGSWPVPVRKTWSWPRRGWWIGTPRLSWKATTALSANRSDQTLTAGFLADGTGPGRNPALSFILPATLLNGHPACRLASLRLERGGEVLREGTGPKPRPLFNSVLSLDYYRLLGVL